MGEQDEIAYIRNYVTRSIESSEIRLAELLDARVQLENELNEIAQEIVTLTFELRDLRRIDSRQEYSSAYQLTPEHYV